MEILARNWPYPSVLSTARAGGLLELSKFQLFMEVRTFEELFTSNKLIVDYSELLISAPTRAPTALEAVPLNCSHVQVSWEWSSDQNGENLCQEIVGFEVRVLDCGTYSLPCIHAVQFQISCVSERSSEAMTMLVAKHVQSPSAVYNVTVGNLEAGQRYGCRVAVLSPRGARGPSSLSLDVTTFLRGLFHLFLVLFFLKAFPSTFSARFRFI